MVLCEEIDKKLNDTAVICFHIPLETIKSRWLFMYKYDHFKWHHLQLSFNTEALNSLFGMRIRNFFSTCFYLYTKIMANNASSRTEKQDDLANLNSPQTQTLQYFCIPTTPASTKKTVETNMQITFHPYTHSR